MCRDCSEIAPPPPGAGKKMPGGRSGAAPRAGGARRGGGRLSQGGGVDIDALAVLSRQRPVAALLLEHAETDRVREGLHVVAVDVDHARLPHLAHLLLDRVAQLAEAVAEG